jgi:hypothetical protein
MNCPVCGASLRYERRTDTGELAVRCVCGYYSFPANGSEEDLKEEDQSSQVEDLLRRDGRI